MKKRILAIVAATLLVISLVPASAFADSVDVKPLYEVTEGNYSFTGSGNPAATFITGTGSYEITTDLSYGAVIINNTAVTVGSDGTVNTENIYIFGSGSLAVGEVTFTTGHSNGITDASDINSVIEAFLAVGSDKLNISGTIGEELRVSDATVPDSEALTLTTGAHLIITENGSFTVADGAALTPGQDAQITVCANATVSGIELYDETLQFCWTDFTHDETFVWLEKDDQEQDIQRWARSAPEGPVEPENIEVIFPDDGSVTVSSNVATYTLGDSRTVTVTVTGAEITIDPGQSTPGNTRYHVFVPANNLDSVTFTLGGDYDAGTMKIILHGAGEFSAELAVNGGETTLSHAGQAGQDIHIPEWVFFDIEVNTPGPGPEPPEPHGGVDWEALESALGNYVFAYGGSTLTAAQAQDLVCKELSERRIGEGLDYSLGEALETTAAVLSSYIDVQGNPADGGAAFGASNDNPLNKPYYSMKIQIADVDPDTEGNQSFSVQTSVYVLDTDRDVVVESKKSGVTQYQIVTVSGDEFGMTCEYIDADSIVGIFGNGVMCNGIDGGGEGVFACHVTQEHSGRTQAESTFPIGARLVLALEQDTVQLTPASGSEAAPWGFQNVGIYSGSGTESDPAEATMFFGAASVELSNPTGSKTISDVEVCNLPADAIEYNAGILNFKTNYDVITLKITYSDATTSYITINRVGLDVNSITCDKYSAVQSGDRFSDEEKAACTGDSFAVMHGTDHSVRYDSDSDKVIIGTFYYNDTTTIHESAGKWYIGSDTSTPYDTKAEAAAAYYAELEHVSLYVTITKTNGSVSHRIVADAITMTGRPANNGGFITDNDNAAGYAGQGSNHFHDDFVLWSGSEADFAAIKSVSAIVYEEGNDESFGGVRVGSGAGVTWNKEN